MVAPGYDFLDNLSGAGAVFLGAALATIGGLAATQMEWYFERRRRGQQAAVFFGEVLTTLHIILDIAHRTHGRGDPFGPITMRMLRSAKGEIAVYDRNRETLFDLGDAKMRSRIHTLILRLNASLEGVFDAGDEIRNVEFRLKSADLTPAQREDLEARLIGLIANREGGYEFTMENAEQLLDTVRALEPMARHAFDIGERAAAEAAAVTGGTIPPA
ncbi:MAG: hypothetical protein ACREHE_16135 [Rhizomicrobium sp.]